MENTYTKIRELLHRKAELQARPNLLLRNNREAKEMRKQLRKIEKEPVLLGYTEAEISPRVLLNLDFARANLKANIYEN